MPPRVRVRNGDELPRFKILPGRWIVECARPWWNLLRRLGKD